MTVIAEFRIPADETALGTTFEELPDLVCKMEQVIVAEDIGLWMSGANQLSLNAALEADPTVEEFSESIAEDERWLYTITFAEEVADLFSIVVEEEGTLLTAVAEQGMWTFRIRFPDRKHVSRVYERLTEHGLTVEPTQITPLTDATADKIGLTSGQYEALTEAIRHGYFEIPRETSMEELADKLDISHQALSERLRRAYQTLVDAEIDGWDDQTQS